MASTSQQRRPVTLQMVAKACHVSTMTVSRAIRSSDCVRPATAKRILTTARRMGYRSGQNMHARRMSLQRHGRSVLNRAIAVFFPPLLLDDASAAYFGPLYDSIMQVMMDEQFSLVTQYTSYPDRSVDHGFIPLTTLPPIVLHGEIDGTILLGHQEEQAHIAGMLRQEPEFRDRPIVSLIQSTAGCSAVLADEYTSAYEAMSHLLKLGHRKVLHFCDLNFHRDIWPQRVKGYTNACRAAGLDPSHVLLFRKWPFANATAAAELITHTVQATPDLTAIIGLFDPMTVDIARILADLGLHVPHDISLIGHDDTAALADPDGANRLSTIRIPLNEIGRRGAELVIQQAKGEQRSTSRITLPTEFIDRQSTAPARPR